MRRGNVVALIALMILVFGLAGAASAAGPSGGRLPGMMNKLEALDWYAPSEPINVKFTLQNTGSQSLWVLRWQVPSDDIDANIFEVTRDGQPVSYTGPMVKRAEPIAEDYIEIRAGQRFTVVFDPSAAYDIGEQGQYTIRYRVHMLDVRTDSPAGLVTAAPTTRVKVVDSNTIGLWFEGIEQPREPGFTEQVIGGYTKCTTSQKSSMQTAHNNATSITNKAKQHLAANPSGSSLYSYWFGTYTSSRFSSVTSHYNAIYDAFVNKSVVYDCGCKKNYYAYVYPNQPYKIYVCRVFWSAPNLGRDSRAGTLVHEMSHFYVTASTDDWVYGATGAHNLALSDPTKAIDNADNHEYFAEDQP